MTFKVDVSFVSATKITFKCGSALRDTSNIHF